MKGEIVVAWLELEQMQHSESARDRCTLLLLHIVFQSMRIVEFTVLRAIVVPAH
jgi:hypothetical protein